MFNPLILLIAALAILAGHIAYMVWFNRDETLPVWPFVVFGVAAVAVSVMSVLRITGHISL
jgi:hypothetical protein